MTAGSSVTCSSCGGVSTDETAAFCGSCGAALARVAPPAAGEGERAGEAERAPIDEAPPPTESEPPRPDGTIPGEPLAAAMKPEAPLAGAPKEKGFAKPKHLAAGTLIDKKYAVLRVLGEGGMGVVYLARDIHTGLDVVVKAVRTELAHRVDVRARTLAEGRALAQIDHPNVVHLRAVAVDGPNLFLVMQYIEGESLDKMIASHVERGEPMPVADALSIFRQVAAGVAAAHEEGVIHRDLKPANVLVRRKDRVAKVTDFGIALVPGDTSRPTTRGILGSLWYMSPEQVVGRRDLDQRIDVYALGILLYQMLVGRVPFDAQTDYDIMKLHAEAPMPLVATSRPDVPASVDALIQKACAKDREQRFQRCEELVQAVDRILASSSSSASPAHPALAPAGLTPPIPLVTPAAADESAAPSPAAEPQRDAASILAATRSGEPSRWGAAPPATDSGSGEPQPSARLPPRRPRRRGPWIALALVLVGATAAGGAAAFGLIPGVPAVAELAALLKPTRHRPDAGAPQPSATTLDGGAVPKSLLDTLVGSWVGNGRELEAVLAGKDLEFRVKKPEQFPFQGYEAGEPRFILHATAEPNVFVVEDRIRPVLPPGKSYDPRARGTCQEVWTAVAGDPLRARYDAPRLSVEFAKIEPSQANFTMVGAKVTSCVALRELKASKVRSTLVRP